MTTGTERFEPKLGGPKQVLAFQSKGGSARYSWPLPIGYIPDAIEDWKHRPSGINPDEEFLGAFGEGTPEYEAGYELMRTHEVPEGSHAPFKFA